MAKLGGGLVPWTLEIHPQECPSQEIYLESGEKICSCLPAPWCSIHIAAERTLRVNTRRFETKSKKFFIPCPHGLVDFFILSNGVPWPRSSFKKLMNFIFWNFLGWHFRLIYLCLQNFLVFQNFEVVQHSGRGDHLWHLWKWPATHSWCHSLSDGAAGLLCNADYCGSKLVAQIGIQHNPPGWHSNKIHWNDSMLSNKIAPEVLKEWWKDIST